MENADFIRLELTAHLIDFLPPDTVLTGDRAACRDTKLKNLATHVFGKRQLALFIGIKQDQRVHVAVASVEDIGNRQAALLGKRRNAFQYAREFAAWDRTVHAVIVRRHTADRREGVLTPGPELGALGFIAGLLNIGGSGFFQHATHGVAIVVHIGLNAVQLAEKDGFGVEGVTRFDKIFGGFDGEFIHHFQAARNDPCRDDIAHRTAGFFDIVEAGHQYLGGFRLGQQLNGNFGDHPEHAFRAVHQG